MPSEPQQSSPTKFSGSQIGNNQSPKTDAADKFDHRQMQFMRIAGNECWGGQTQKIMALQEELLGTRKELSRRQNEWEKEKSHLLHKIQLDNMEIGEFKQRLNNLSKINQTLTEALSSDTGMQEVVYAVKAMAIRVMGHEEAQEVYTRISKNSDPQKIPDYSSQSQQGKGELNKQMKSKVNALEKAKQESDRKISCYLEMISNLQSKAASLAHEGVVKDNSIIKLERSLEQAKELMEKKQEQILNCHKQISMISRLVEQKVALTSRSPQHKTRPNAANKTSRNLDEQARQGSDVNHACALVSDRQGIKRKQKLTIQQLQQQYAGSKKYASNANSQYLMLKPTSDHSMSDQVCDNSSYMRDLSIQDQQSEWDCQPTRCAEVRLFDKGINRYSRQACVQPDYISARHGFQQEFVQQWQCAPFYNQNCSEEHYLKQEEEQRLLCEVCNKVFPFHLFQDHMKSCGYQKQADITELLQRKKSIVNQLENLKSKDEKENRRFQNEKRKKNNLASKGAEKVLDSNPHRPSRRCSNAEYVNDFSIKNRNYGF